MDNVDLISNVKPGTTINISTREVVPHDYYNGLYRWWYAEDRNKLLIWLENVTKDELGKILTMEHRTRLRTMASGMRSLANTYIGTNIADSIVELVRKIENKLLEIKLPLNIYSGSYFNRY